MAQEFGAQGCRIAVCARDQQEIDIALADLALRGIEAEGFPCDVTKDADLDQLIARVTAKFGSIDILVNNAGLIQVSPVQDLQHQDFEEAMNLMFWAPVNLTLKVLPKLRAQGGGHVINISSVGGRVAIPHLLPYCCAKFALTGFSTGLSSELDSEQIHVLTVTPGLMRTGSYLQAEFKGKRETEFAWFSLVGNIPGVSVPVSQAARNIREALENRETSCTVSLPAKLLIQSEALLPEATRTVMQMVNSYVLPAAGGNTEAAKGKQLNKRWGSLFQLLTSLGRNAARVYNQ